MKKILTLLMLVPLFSLMLVPIATVSATSDNVEIWVGCYTGSSVPASVSLTYVTQHIHVACQDDSGPLETGACLAVTANSGFKVTTTVDGRTESFKGTFGPNTGEFTGTQGSPLAPGDLAYSYWGIENTGCG